MIGLKEIMKNLFAQKLTMVIVATNIERVEGDGGLDDALQQIGQECRKQAIPLIYTLSRT